MTSTYYTRIVYLSCWDVSVASFTHNKLTNIILIFGISDVPPPLCGSDARFICTLYLLLIRDLIATSTFEQPEALVFYTYFVEFICFNALYIEISFVTSVPVAIICAQHCTILRETHDKCYRMEDIDTIRSVSKNDCQHDAFLSIHQPHSFVFILFVFITVICERPL